MTSTESDLILRYLCQPAIKGRDGNPGEPAGGLYPDWRPTPEQTTLWHKHLAGMMYYDAINACDEMFARQRFKKNGPDLALFADGLKSKRVAAQTGTAGDKESLHDGNGGAWIVDRNGGRLWSPGAYATSKPLPPISTCMEHAHKLRDKLGRDYPRSDWVVVADPGRRVTFAEAHATAMEYWPAARRLGAEAWAEAHPTPERILAGLPVEPA